METLQQTKMKDKSCIIVGGAGGIGMQICHQLLENRIKNLAIVDIQPDPTGEWACVDATTKISYFQIDITDEKVLRETFNRIHGMFESIDVLINAAGIFNDEDIDLTFKVNVFGLMYATLCGVDLMHKTKRTNQTTGNGIIINIASVVALDPWHLMPIYTASKHAIVGFSRAFSHEYYYDETGVRIVVLCPGPTRTAFLTQFAGKMICPDESEAMRFFKKIPVQSAEAVGKHVMELIESADNGSVWISDCGTLKQTNMSTYHMSM